MPMWLIWTILMIVFLIFEAATMGLSTIWCAVGCLAAAIAAALDAPLWLQVTLMVVISVILFAVFLIWIKPNFGGLKKAEKKPTNADRLIGVTGIIVEDIVSVDGKGQVKVKGQVWSAAADEDLTAGTEVIVQSIKGVHLEVVKK